MIEKEVVDDVRVVPDPLVHELQDDGLAPAAEVWRDAQEPAPGVRVALALKQF